MLPSLACLSISAPFAAERIAAPNVGKKRTRTIQSGVVLSARALSGPISLDTNGVTTFPLSVNGANFAKELRECTHAWFHANFAKMLAEGTDTMLRDQLILAAKVKWDALSLDVKRSYVKLIDLRTDEGMRLAFDLNYLDNREWFKNMPGKDFYRACVIYVKQGNMGMSLGNMAGAWTAKGFGLWAHIVPDAGLTMVTEAMRFMESLGLTPGLPDHFPHPIYKPPGGKALEIHHDQMAPQDLLENLRKHVNTKDPSTTAWVRKHGCQMLAHLQGGTGTGDGATFIVGPMTPTKLLFCLEVYSKGGLGGAHVEWCNKPVGKIDLDWEEHLNDLNIELAKAGHERIGLLAAAPLKAIGEAYTSFGVCFPVGWPHGSFANSKLENPAGGLGSRITITLPVTIRGSTQVPDTRIPQRLRNMAVLSSGGHTACEYKNAEEWLVNETRPYASGPTHKHPEKVTDLIRHPHAGLTGPFWPISVKSATVETYLAELERIEALQLLTEVPLQVPLQVPPPPTLSQPPPLPELVAPAEMHASWRAPPSVDVLNDDVHILKVRQPWATMLVKGIKDVENRTWTLTPTKVFPKWVLVASSKSKPTTDTMNDLRNRLLRCQPRGHTLALAYDTDPDKYVYGSILGMVKIGGSYPEGPPQQSVWYNQGDVAWHIIDAWEFETPIPLDCEDGMQTQASLKIRRQYWARIVEEMGKLEAGQW